MEHPELDLFRLMRNQQSVFGRHWFTNGEAQGMADLASSGSLNLSVLEHHVFAMEEINEAIDDGLLARHGRFSNVILTSDQCTPVLITCATSRNFIRVGPKSVGVTQATHKQCLLVLLDAISCHVGATACDHAYGTMASIFGADRAEPAGQSCD